MRIYLAGGQPSWRDSLEGHHLLVSYAEPRQCKIITAGWDTRGILLDSGAFTVWTQGAAVDLGAYCEFIAAHANQLAGYFALDVIGGTAADNLANLDHMESAGLRAIPVYHEGDDPQYLAELVRRGYPLIGLGATTLRGRPELVDWLIPIFEAYPEQGFHGLAMTQARLVRHIPFRSVDSSSWLNFSRYGVDANTYLLKGRSPAFNRALGIAALLDIPPCPPNATATKNGQLRLLPTSEAV